jgi:hypothetical protein
VKTSGDRFTKSQLQRDFALSKRLGADMHVMAWLGEIPSGALDTAQFLAERLGLSLQLLALDEVRL